MAKSEGLNAPVKLNADLAKFIGKGEASRAEITSKIWDHVKKHKLQSKTVNGKPEGAGKNIVLDEALHSLVKNTNVTTKAGKKVDLTKVKVGQTIDMMQVASVVGANLA